MIYLRNITEVHPMEIDICCPECRAVIFGFDLEKSSDHRSAGDWLLRQKELVESGKKDVYMLWDTDDSCGPLTTVSISYSENNPQVGKLDSWGKLTCCHSGLAAASCQYAISQAFNSGKISRITTEIDVDDLVAKQMYSLVPLVEAPTPEGMRLGDFADDDLILSLDSNNPAIAEWNFNKILDEADARHYYANIAKYLVRDLFQISTPFVPREA